jgi:hypothetical protein
VIRRWSGALSGKTRWPTPVRRRARHSGWHQDAATLAVPAPVIIRVTMLPARCPEPAANATPGTPALRSGAAITTDRGVVPDRPVSPQRPPSHRIVAEAIGGVLVSIRIRQATPMRAGPCHPSERPASSRTSDTYPAHPGRQRSRRIQIEPTGRVSNGWLVGYRPLPAARFVGRVCLRRIAESARDLSSAPLGGWPCRLADTVRPPDPVTFMCRQFAADGWMLSRGWLPEHSRFGCRDRRASCS